MATKPNSIFKRAARAFVRLLLAAVLFPALAHAQFTYTTNADSTLTLTGYTGPMGEVTIPTNINGATVTGIASSAFAANANIFAVTIPGAITNLGSSLFYGCTNLTNVTFGSGPTLIRTNEFYNCSGLTSIVIPSNVMSIESAAFLSCSNLSSVSFAPGIGSIGQFAFFSCGVTNMFFPATITNIGSSAFSPCPCLTNVVILGNCNIGLDAFSLEYSPFPGDHLPPTTLRSVYIAGGTVGVSAFSGCSNLSSVTLGPLVNGAIPAGVSNIQDDAFQNCTALTNLMFPTNLVDIGQSAFQNCTALDNLIIPANLANIGSSAFQSCTNLRNLFLAPGLVSVGNSAFVASGVTNLIIPATVTNISSNAFYNCLQLTNLLILGNCYIGPFAFGIDGVMNGGPIPNLHSVYIAGGVIGSSAFWESSNLTSLTLGNVTSIGDSAFYSAGVKSLIVPDSCTNIGNFAFELNGMTNLDLGHGIQSIGNYCFTGNAVTSLALPSSLRSLGDLPFGLPLTNLTIANGVTTFSDRAFTSTALTYITLPPSLTSIGSYADFAFNSNLTSVVFLGNAPFIGPYQSFDTRNVTVFYLPGAKGWSITFNGNPTAVWNPTLQKHDGNFGVRNGRFGFNVTGANNLPLAVQSSTNPKSGWTNVTTATLTNGSFYFSDPQPVSGSARFYRLMPPP